MLCNGNAISKIHFKHNMENSCPQTAGDIDRSVQLLSNVNTMYCPTLHLQRLTEHPLFYWQCNKKTMDLMRHNRHTEQKVA